MLQRLTRGLAAGDILLLHDGNAARGDDGRAVLLSVLPALLQAMAGQGLHAARCRTPTPKAPPGGLPMPPIPPTAGTATGASNSATSANSAVAARSAIGADSVPPAGAVKAPDAMAA